MPKGLKINRPNITLYDSAQTAGVEYKDEDNEYNNQEEESEKKYKESDSDSDSSNKDSLSEQLRWPDSDSNSKSSLEDSDDELDSTNINKQVYTLDGHISTTGVQNHINNKEDNKDTSEEDTIINTQRS